MKWHRELRRKTGGYWRCRLRQRAADAKWRAENPDKVAARIAGSNPKRIYVGTTYYGRAATAEKAAEINAHCRGMLADFNARQRDERQEEERRRAGDLP